MKQVGFRQEASRLGGIGSCGRELCCSTWLTDFRSVNTSAARYQQLSLNPQKLAGQCGKLKCCLNYELDTYLDALKGLPDMDTKIYTEKGDAICQKIDIFKGLMWFAYTSNMAHWHVISAENVREMMALNKQKERVASLEDYATEIAVEPPEKHFQNAVGQDSLTRFDAPKKKNKKRPGSNNKNKISANANAGAAPAIIAKTNTGTNAIVAKTNTGGAQPNEPKGGNAQGGGNNNNRNQSRNNNNRNNNNRNQQGGQNQNKDRQDNNKIKPANDKNANDQK
jgi:hypothetical protein